MTVSGLEAGREALDRLDAVLARRPNKDDYGLSEVTALLCLYRDAVIAPARSGGAEARKRLSHVNAILSVVVGMHYPLGEPPWEELQKARGWLTDLLAQTPSAAVTHGG